MTRLGFSKHIPDLGLITHYSEFGDSPVHRINPWIKFALLPLIIFDLTVVSNGTLLTFMYLAVLIFWVASESPVVLLAYWYTMPLFFVVSIAFFLMFAVPGAPLISCGPLQLTVQGLEFLATLVLRSLIGVTYSLTLLMTTKYNYITHIISKVMPSPLDQIALLMYRFLFLMLDGLASTIVAMKSRGGLNLSGIKEASTFYGAVFALAFIRSFDRAERVAKAMESRAYDGKLASSFSPPRLAYSGYAFILSAAFISVILYSYGRFSLI
ncbi:MAG: cobalt ECF transporter T component CbiQ [Halobacteriota archaeon]|jgi:cobalt/nickel transport system permease protein